MPDLLALRFQPLALGAAEGMTELLTELER